MFCLPALTAYNECSNRIAQNTNIRIRSCLCTVCKRSHRWTLWAYGSAGDADIHHLQRWEWKWGIHYSIFRILHGEDTTLLSPNQICWQSWFLKAMDYSIWESFTAKVKSHQKSFLLEDVIHTVWNTVSSTMVHGGHSLESPWKLSAEPDILAERLDSSFKWLS